MVETEEGQSKQVCIRVPKDKKKKKKEKNWTELILKTIPGKLSGNKNNTYIFKRSMEVTGKLNQNDQFENISQ